MKNAEKEEENFRIFTLGTISVCTERIEGHLQTGNGFRKFTRFSIYDQ